MLLGAIHTWVADHLHYPAHLWVCPLPALWVKVENSHLTSWNGECSPCSARNRHHRSWTESPDLEEGGYKITHWVLFKKQTSKGNQLTQHNHLATQVHKTCVWSSMHKSAFTSINPANYCVVPLHSLWPRQLQWIISSSQCTVLKIYPQR